MARLRVPASPVKARQMASAAVSKQTNDRPSYDPRSASPIFLARSEQALETSPLPRSFDRSPIKGSVKSLTSISRATKSDVQGYITGKYKAFEKIGHEHVNQTGTRTVFFLVGEEKEEEELEHLDEVMKTDLGAYINEEKDSDQPWSEIREFTQMDASLKTGASARIRAPSLAQCIANAGIDDTETDHDSDSEDDEIDLSKEVEHAISSFARKIEGCKDDQEDMTPTPLMNNYAVRQLPLLSTLEATDISYPRTPKHGFGHRRHSGDRSLAFLIARADDVSSSPNDDSRSPSRFLSISPSPFSSSSSSPNAGNGSLSANDALEILRERFRMVHCAGGGTSCYHREWLDAKFELGCLMVHGPSLLRFATNCYEDEELERSKDAGIITYTNPNDVRARTSPSKDTLNTKSSIQTSLFSKCTSATSMSSYRNCRPQSAQSEDEQRILSLPILTAEHRFGELRVEEIAQSCVSLPTSAKEFREMSHVVMADDTCDVQLEREETFDFYDNVSTDSDHDTESIPAVSNTSTRSRHKWTSRAKHCFRKIPKKTKQATHDCVKATTKFSRTAWTFVPAALSRRHPFQKIDSII